MDIKDIQNLIKFVAKSEVSEVKYKTGEFEILIKTNSTPNVIYTSAPQTIQVPVAQTTQTAPAVNASAPVEDTSKYVTIKSPMIGTFYRKPAPDRDIFVNIGDTVTVGTTVCVIEAMKLFNEIESEVSGKIVKILVDDSSPVDFDQPLFLVDPS